ncbi:MAG: xanthine dehydrogenase family protein molybdopterin-binding subunit [Xanthobacteraceae bacterium]|nr:xanthine dehydrogenase family protein molybdopterin-binding subunit [Xanthobacteraceae bacterium]MCW5676967.1 xanthine dehydrogenase family protein molybdopterin-binding subunit [Xanthobacteraceae bacterium]
MNSPFRIIGKSFPRLDARGKVSGKAIYGTDFAMQGMLHGKLVHSPIASGEIISVDTSRAMAMPGVYEVVTAKDIPAQRYGSFVKDMEVFASGRVNFIGQPVAAVVARTAEEAEAAAKAVKVEYREQAAVFTTEDAVKADAPLVHPDWQEYKAVPTVKRQGNITNQARLVLGDVDKALKESYRVFTHRFVTNVVHPGYTEPRAAIAHWADGSQLHVWSNTQLPFEAQATLAEIFKITPSQVRVNVTVIGGGFGGKLRLGVEHYAAAAALKAGRPVKFVSSCEEEMTSALPRQPLTIDLTTGVTKDGKILAKAASILVDTGATSGSGVGVASSVMLMLAGPYKSPNLRLESRSVYTNKTPTGSFRAPAGPQGNFAVESQMDIIADALGIDPLEFRLRNIVREGDLAPNGQKLESVSLEECLLKAADAIGWKDRRPEPGRGKGIACAWWTTTSGSSGVYVKVGPDGQVFLNTGCAEIGTAALTGAAQVLAEALGIELGSIQIVSGDTASTPFDFGAQGSRTAFAVGNACIDAVGKLHQRMKEIAAKQFSAKAEEIEIDGGAAKFGDKLLSLKEIAAIAQTSQGGLIAHGTFIAPPTLHDKERTENMVITAINSPSFHAHAVDLSVDAETGEVKIHDYVVVQDVGRAINPTYIEGQIEGGVVQGIGQALSEEIVYENGIVRNAGLTDYKMPTAMDAPNIRSFIVESPSKVGPYGAKGVGEPPVIHPPATIANAIASAVSARVQTLPITAEKIVRTLTEVSETAK